VQLVPDSLLALVVVAAGVFAPLSAWFATRRSRQPALWFVFGGLTGPLALVLLALAPPGRCPSCAAPVDGWPLTCQRCGRALGPSPAPLMAIPAHPSIPEPPVGVTGPVAIAAEAPPSLTGEIVSIVVYVSGNAGLEIGATYGLSRVPGPNGDRLRVFGPVDAGQITVRHEGPLDAFDVTGVDDRVIVSRRDGRSSKVWVFRALGGKRGVDLEDALTGTPVSHP
jgi:hypothetical protein